MIDNQQPYRERQLHLTTRFYGDRAFVLSRRGARRNVGSQPKSYRFPEAVTVLTASSDNLSGNLYRSMRAVFIANKSLFISQHIGWKTQMQIGRSNTVAAGQQVTDFVRQVIIPFLIPSKAQSAYARAHSAIRCLSIP